MNIKSAVQMLLVLCTLSACVTSPNESHEVPKHVFNQQSRYAVLWIKPCAEKILGGCEIDDGRTAEAKYVVHGPADQIDLKQEYEDKIGLTASIARLNASNSVENQYLRTVREKMLNKGLNVVALAKPLHEGLLVNRSRKVVEFELPNVSATQFPLQLKNNNFDFTELYQRLDADYLVVLELLKFSVDQHFGPTGQENGNPQVTTAVRLYLHEKVTDELMFNDFSYNATIAKDGWDDPPLYESLESSLLTSLDQAIAEASGKLLK